MDKEFVVNTYTDDSQMNPSITSLTDGGFVIIWTSPDQREGDDLYYWGQDIYAQRYDSDSQPVGEEFLVNSYTEGYQWSPDITGLTDNGFVVTWTSPDQREQDDSYYYYGEDIYAQRYDDNGQPVGEEFLVNSYTDDSQIYPSITSLTNGGFVIAWTSLDQREGDDLYYYGEDIYAQRYDENGQPEGEEFLVNSYTDGYQRSPSIAGLKDGGFVVTWMSPDQREQDGSYYYGEDIYAQRYDDNGQPVGEEFLVNSHTDGYQESPVITSLTNGGFVIAWTSPDQREGDDLYYWGRDIYAQRYDENGQPEGEEFLVNSYTDDYQESPSIASLTDGGFIIIWTSRDRTNEGSSYYYGEDIYAQRYDSNGEPLGSEFRINSYTDGSQWSPDIAGLTDEKFVVTWQSPEQDSSSYYMTDIYAHSFSSSDFIYGTQEDDTINGTPETQIIFGQAGQDLISGNMSNDWIYGGIGNDTLNGYLGNDTLEGEEGRDLLNGDLGDDRLYGGIGNDTLNGSLGNDTLNGGENKDLLDGDAGDDRLYGSQDNDTVNGDNGNDIVYGGQNNDLLSGEEGDDYLSGDHGDDTLNGNDGNDSLEGDWDSGYSDDGFYRYGVCIGNDILYGDAGNDWLYGGLSNDTLNGGTGSDTLKGGEGQDQLNGDAGNDQLFGNQGDDTLTGGDGNDTLHGGQDNDLLSGGQGNDNLLGDRGDDNLSGDAGEDLLCGNQGDDTLTGGDGSDTLYGGQNDDILDGGQGHDSLLGDRGNDSITGGDGDDTLTGGNGGDRFVFTNEGIDTVTDFKAEDLDIFALTSADYAGAPVAGTAVVFTDAADANDSAANIIVDSLTNIRGISLANTRFAFDTTNNNLLYDADGDWSTGNLTIAEATVDGTLSAANFAFV